jgi:hypothetical protein
MPLNIYGRDDGPRHDRRSLAQATVLPMLAPGRP